MRRTIFAVALLLVAALPAFAVTRTVMVVDDVIRMSQAGVGDEEIIAFVNKNATPFEINGDDVIAMQNAKVSPAVMKVVIDASVASMRAARGNNNGYGHYDSSAPAAGNSTTVVVPPAYGYPYDGYYDGYAYPYYYSPYSYPYSGYYSPYWWYPSVSVGFGFGYYGHGYYGHGGYHGGHGGGYHGGHGGGGHSGHPGGGHSGGGHGGHH